MPGGPINGSAIYGDAMLKYEPAATIIVPTMLQISSDMIDSFTHLTCLYDRYWSPRADMVTSPLCFFYVKNISETRQIETSEQRIILYEPQITGEAATMKALSDQLRKGVQEVVVDNIVMKPKTYQLEIIVPYLLVSKQFIRTVQEAKQIFAAFFEVLTEIPTSQTLASAMPQINQLLQSADKVLDITAKFPDNNSANFVNKNSLDAMAESQRVLTMKMWTGYEYKFVLITGIDIKKVGNEDDVFRATLQVKELPVLTVTPANDAMSPGIIDMNWAAQAVSYTSRLMVEPLKSITGVSAAAGG